MLVLSSCVFEIVFEIEDENCSICDQDFCEMGMRE